MIKTSRRASLWFTVQTTTEQHDFKLCTVDVKLARQPQFPGPSFMWEGLYVLTYIHMCAHVHTQDTLFIWGFKRLTQRVCYDIR